MRRWPWIGLLLALLAGGCGGGLQAVPSAAEGWPVLGANSGRTWQGQDLALETQPDLAWSRIVAEPGERLQWAVADRERLYVDGYATGGGGPFIKAVRLSDGQPVWQCRGDLGGELALAGGRLFQVGYPDGARALDAATGAVLWRRPVACKYALSFLADADRVYVLGRDPPERTLMYAMAADDGRLLWTSELPFDDSVSDRGFAMRPGLLVVGGTERASPGAMAKAIALRPEDGGRLWEREPPGVAGSGRVPPELLPGMTLTPNGFWVVAASKFYFYTFYPELLVYDLGAGGLAWKKRLLFEFFPDAAEAGIATDGARLFVNDYALGGEIHAFDLRTGARLWRTSFNKKGLGLGHPVVSGKTVLVLDAEGGLRGLAARGGRTLWQTTLAPFKVPDYLGKVFLSDLEQRVLVAGGRIVVFDDRTVWALTPRAHERAAGRKSGAGFGK